MKRFSQPSHSTIPRDICDRAWRTRDLRHVPRLISKNEAENFFAFNLNFEANCGFALNLIQIAAAFPANAEYNALSSPTLTFRLERPQLTLIISSDGICTLNGQYFHRIESAWPWLYFKVLLPFRR